MPEIADQARIDARSTEILGSAYRQLEWLRHQLLQHPIYEAVDGLAALQIFMQQHVFAVWDFMSLLKRLQREVTCVSVPWLPPAQPAACRFITEILLGEECDEDGSGGHISHFELYRSAMHEVGADVRPVDDFLERLRSGESLTEALAHDAILPTTRTFVSQTLNLAQHGASWEVAAAFFHSREDLIPEMFQRLVTVLAREGLPIPKFLHYLRRHIEVDGDEHGPLADQLLQQLCAGDSTRETQAIEVACQALRARLQLWDGILHAIGSDIPARKNPAAGG